MASIGKSSGGALLAVVAMAVAFTCEADTVADAQGPAESTSLLQQARGLLHDGTSRLGALLAAGIQGVRGHGKPDWLLEQSPQRFAADDAAVSLTDPLQVVIQQERGDGADLLTLRYALDSTGALRTYAGAGINRAVYFADSASGVPTFLSGHTRHRSMGAAAELGAQLQLNRRMTLGADVRWIGIDSRADLLRTPDGLVGADPVTVGVRLGWQFR